MEDAIAVWKEEGREEGSEEGETHVLSLLEAGHSIEDVKKILSREHEKCGM